MSISPTPAMNLRYNPNPRARAAAALLLCAALAACSPDVPMGPNDPRDVPLQDTDPAFMQALLRDDISSREAPKPGARFVLSSAQQTNTKYHHRASHIISAVDGCSYQVAYDSSDDAAVGKIPGAPYADAGMLAARADLANFSLSASGEARAREAMRPDLARARAVASKVQDGSLAMNKAFAQALPDLMKAKAEVEANKSPPDPKSHFVRIASPSKETGYSFLERSTGCQWNLNMTSKLTTPVSITPASCLASPAPASAAAAASSASGA